MDLNKVFIEKALYPAMEKLRGNQIRVYEKELMQSQLLPEDELHALQAQKLRRLLTACMESVPAYSGLLTKQAIEDDPFAALRSLPVLSKKTFRENAEQYLNTSRTKESMIPNLTGGSTSEPVHFFMDRYAVEHYEAARWRGLSWWGITQGSRCVMVWGNPVELSQNEIKKTQMKEKYLKNRVVISAYDLDPKKADEYLAFLNRYRPEYLYGYSNALYLFAQLLSERRSELKVKLKVIVSTSETLHAYQRELLTKVFGCPVTNEYGARDAGILAYQCREGNLHISAENVIFELVDPQTLQPVKKGESGLVVTTDLNNLAQPRLRYLLGDTATLSDTPCTCGLGLPVLKSVDGREDAIFRLPDGKLVHGDIGTHLIRYFDTLLQSQLIQTDPANITMKIVHTGQKPEEVEAYRQKLLESLPGVTIHVEEVDEIPVSKSGKVRIAIRQFPLF